MFEINMCFTVMRRKTGVNGKNTEGPRKMSKGENKDIIET